tara:strand:+ start:190 stop:390 length:201 start_codon:yes stop_codon:yes gene_type:complete
MSTKRKLKVIGIVLGTIVPLMILITYLVGQGVVSSQQGGLMAVAVFGMYVGFGTLIVVYRLIGKLD